MSDGMTDTRSQVERVLSDARLMMIQPGIRDSISKQIFDNESFQEMKVSEVKRVIEHMTTIVINELRLVVK